MFAATRRWFRRNRTPIAVGVGLVGAGYVVTQYVFSKINDARERMSSERIAKENLRRRFEQNQEDCTFTVLALLPTATANILEAMETEKITYEIQKMKGGNGTNKSVKSASDSISIPDTVGLTDEDGRSMISMRSESGVHVSQVAVPPAGQAGESSTTGEQQQPERPRRTKRQLWGDLTISSITRAYALLYTLGLLTMLTRIQLNLLGRRSYLSSVVSLATGSNQGIISLENNDDDNSNQTYGDDFEVNRKYLAFSWWLLNKGWMDIMQRVESAVRDVFGHLSPRDQLSFDTLSSMTAQVRRLVESGQQGGPAKWLSFLLPPLDMEDLVLKESGILDDSAASHTATGRPAPPPSPTSTASLRRLLDETSDLIESPPFAHVLTQILDAGFFTLLAQKVGGGAFELPPPAPDGVSPELHRLRAEKKIPLPKILSVLTRQAHAIGNGMPNDYLQEMERVRDLEGFAAVVYSSNWESEVVRDEMGMLPANNGSSRSSKEGATEASSLRARTTASSSVRQSQVEGSMVLMDPSQSSFERIWARTVEKAT